MKPQHSGWNPDPGASMSHLVDLPKNVCSDEIHTEQCSEVCTLTFSSLSQSSFNDGRTV